MNNLLDCAVPTDCVAFGATCRDMFTKYGKPRAKKDQMRWNNVKAVYAWEKLMGGPRFDFPEGTFKDSHVGPLAVELADTVFIEQSQKGVNALTHDVTIPTNPRVKQGTYEAIVKRALGNRLTAKEIPSYEITLKEYSADGDSTFTVVHNVIGGAKEEVLDAAIKATKTQVEIKAVAEELKAAKNHVASAILQSQSISERAAKLKEDSKELAEVDASAPISALRDAAKEPMEKIRETLTSLDKASSSEVFAEKIGNGAGDGKQVEYRKNVAESLGKWLQVQNEAIAAAVENANSQLLEKSMSDTNCSADTEELKVKGAAEPAPEFLDFDDAVKVLDILFQAQLEKALGDSAKAEKAPGDDILKWTVTLEMEC
jgi:type II secretory pathway component PulM